MSNRNKILFMMIFFCWIVFSIIGIVWSYHKLTYLEKKTVKIQEFSCSGLEDGRATIECWFEMPYDLVNKIHLKTNYLDVIGDSEAIIIEDCDLNRLSSFDDVKKVEDGFVASYKKDTSVNKEQKYLLKMIVPGETIDAMSIDENIMEVKLYGGERDYWWLRYILLIMIFVLAIIIRAFVLCKKGESVFADLYIRIMLITALAFILLFSFAWATPFNDESDNFFAGMIIKNGGVIYKDYVSQHTPFTYYLCSIFALFGASSLEQFRLSYYIFESILWGLIAWRHYNALGWKRIMLLSASIIVFSSQVALVSTEIVSSKYQAQVLSDSVEGFLIVILLLEFITYVKDKRLGWCRSIIVSLCFWGCIGAAFVSVYALIWIVIGFVFVEIFFWKKRSFKAADAGMRYYRLIIAIITPLVLAVLYFWINNAFVRAIQQSYLFNREVYAGYVDGLGSSIVQPFIDCIINYFAVYKNGVLRFIQGDISYNIVLQIVILGCSLGTVVYSVIKRKEYATIVCFLAMIFAGSRGYSFHGLAAWYIAIMIIVLNVDLPFNSGSTLKIIIFVVALITLSYGYFVDVVCNLSREQMPVSSFESKVIELTEGDEDKRIYFDIVSYDTLYFCYKDRWPVNSAIFMFPWYMQWFEDEDTESLLDNMPHIAVYNDSLHASLYGYLPTNFLSVLNSNYTRYSNDERNFYNSIWVKNNSDRK